jgi:hypothetical protein
MKSKQMIMRYTLMAAIMLSAGILSAQPGGGGGQGLGGTPPATGAPIDGGSSILLAGVAAYAHRRLKARSQNKKD